MHFLKYLATAVLISLAYAQAGLLQITSKTADLAVGEPITIHYDAPSEDMPVTILLKNNEGLDPTIVTTLTTSSFGGTFLWTVPSTLAAGSHYFFEIRQGEDTCETNEFSIQGLVDAPAVPNLLAPSRIASVVHMVRPRTIGMANYPAITPAPTRHVPLPVLKVPSMGTGSPIPRNTTFVSPTLKPTAPTPPPATTAQTPPTAVTSNVVTPSPGAGSNVNVQLSFSALAALILAGYFA